MWKYFIPFAGCYWLMNKKTDFMQEPMINLWIYLLGNLFQFSLFVSFLAALFLDVGGR